jgi:hypothetical protein
MSSDMPPYALSHAPGSFSRFRKKAWTFQFTIQTPLARLEPFVHEIITALEPIRKGVVTIDGYVFEPKNTRKLLSTFPSSLNLTHDWSIESVAADNIKKLLLASLQDWIDFAFIPTPQPFVFYSDHDKYTTFYAMTKSNLNRVMKPLLAQDFTQAKDFRRAL